MSGQGPRDSAATAMRSQHVVALPDETATCKLGAALAASIAPRTVIHLHGELGAGKTALSRALVQSLAPGTRVKSPTYTLIESYDTPRGTIHHLDLYRIADPGELEFLGLADLAAAGGSLVIEWPGKGGDATPPADLVVALAYAGSGRSALLTAVSSPGESLLASVLAAHDPTAP